MADPVSTFFAVLGLATSTWSFCETLYQQLKDLRSAGSYIQRTAHELKLLCPVLGGLHAALLKEQRNSHSGIIPTTMAENLQDLLRGCATILTDIDTLIQPYVLASAANARLSSLKSYMWQRSNKENLLVLQRALASYKLTVNVACSSFVLLRESQTQDMVEDLRQDVLQLCGRVEESLHADVDTSPATSRRGQAPIDQVDRQRLSIYNLPLQRFLSRTGSLISQSSAGATQDSSSVVSDVSCDQPDANGEASLPADLGALDKPLAAEQPESEDTDLTSIEYTWPNYAFEFSDPCGAQAWPKRSRPVSDDTLLSYDDFKQAYRNSRASASPTITLASSLPSSSPRSRIASDPESSFSKPQSPQEELDPVASTEEQAFNVVRRPKLYLTIPGSRPRAVSAGGLRRSPARRVSPRQDWCNHLSQPSSSTTAVNSSTSLSTSTPWRSGSAAVGGGGLLTPDSPRTAVERRPI